MDYTSAQFFIFVALTVLIYYLPFLREYQWIILLLASVVFYSYTGIPFLVFITAAIFTVYLGAILIETFREKEKKRCSTVLVIALILLFGVLIFFKYEYYVLSFLREVLNPGIKGDPIRPIYLVLPLGISFYTFQAAGYIIDVSREKIKAERNFFKLALFLSFFPQITQGPISFYSDLAGQLYESRKFDFIRLKLGLELILWGYFKKCVIADRMSPIISNVMTDYQSFSGSADAFVLLIYAVQLYTDFSAGIDISRGIGEIMGISLPENFRRPYFSLSLGEYWRRWHITLGAWMKNYIFFPIAVSKKSVRLRKKVRSTGFGKTGFGKHAANVLPGCLGTIIVFLIVGMWHGATWRFVFFGIYNGSIIALSMLMEPVFNRIKERAGIRDGSIPFMCFQYLRTMFLILIGYVFDIAPSLRAGFDMIRRIFTEENLPLFIKEEFPVFFGVDMVPKQVCFNYLVIFFSCILLLIVSICQERTGDALRNRFDKMPFPVQWLGIFILAVAVFTFGAYGPGYDMRGFVYTKF